MTVVLVEVVVFVSLLGAVGVAKHWAAGDREQKEDRSAHKACCFGRSEFAYLSVEHKIVSNIIQ